MVYTMEIYVDGGCRGNGILGHRRRGRGHQETEWRLQGLHPGIAIGPHSDQPACRDHRLILALELVLEQRDKLDTNPRFDVTIYSDSRYAVGCMTEWLGKWEGNGWINSRGEEVANRDLIEEASDLDYRVRDIEDLSYCYIPREQNQYADNLCNERLDQEDQQGQQNGYSTDDSWY
ncbi:ribonuclease H-like domain-containing protein [Aspergillus keveii]|uniref:ribonuclease H n=1 Tax=Aspergillus keveii TaxID=714993 RepID=A0ABR4GPC5_9EURO